MAKYLPGIWTKPGENIASYKERKMGKKYLVAIVNPQADTWKLFSKKFAVYKSLRYPYLVFDIFFPLQNIKCSANSIDSLIASYWTERSLNYSSLNAAHTNQDIMDLNGYPDCKGMMKIFFSLKMPSEAGGMNIISALQRYLEPFLVLDTVYAIDN
ncbi:hypothetical protein NPIL_303561 [Nephila pilipes]|uniref:Uncharacterized protein n=1 Tax=Nephila pilipes TaxID=299642 RepID=A0A8X6QGS4_NEPPI|nr:hypothetical protein NPIL_303561 [Nephila pilipes]